MCCLSFLKEESVSVAGCLIPYYSMFKYPPRTHIHGWVESPVSTTQRRKNNETAPEWKHGVLENSWRQIISNYGCYCLPHDTKMAAVGKGRQKLTEDRLLCPVGKSPLESPVSLCQQGFAAHPCCRFESAQFYGYYFSAPLPLIAGLLIRTPASYLNGAGYL